MWGWAKSSATGDGFGAIGEPDFGASPCIVEQIRPAQRQSAAPWARPSDSVAVCVVDGLASRAARTFYLAHELLAEAGVRPGDAADGAKLAELQQRSEVMLAGRRALRLLARSMHSRRVLARKLQQGGFAAAAVEQTLARLDEIGYLDDAGFARLWVRGRVERRNEGRAKVLAGLQRCGISRHDAAAALASEYPADVEADLCRQLAASLLERYRSDPRAGRRVARQLARRGFPSHLIADALPGATFDGGGSE